MLKSDLPITCRTVGPEETFQLATRFAALSQPGNLILLQGDLGAGKTHFVRGFCAGLGMTELWEVDSPTYTLHNHYAVAQGVDHLDLYRFSDAAELDEIHFEELLDAPSIVVIEWPERLRGYSPMPVPDYLVQFAIVDEEVRTITIKLVTGEA